MYYERTKHMDMQYYFIQDITAERKKSFRISPLQTILSTYLGSLFQFISGKSWGLVSGKLGVKLISNDKILVFYNILSSI